MKKKKASLTLVAILALVLAGCGNSTAQSQHYKESTQAKTEQTKQSAVKKGSSKISLSETYQQTSTTEQVNSQNVSEKFSKVASSQSEKAQQFSDDKQAASYVDNQGYQTSAETQGLPTVNLGYGITGTIDSGAGQQYLHWNEGNWSFTVRASAVDGQDPLPTAKKIVSILEKVYLPAPQNQGTGMFDIATDTYQLTWQEGNQVHTVTGNSPDDVINKATQK